MTKTCTGPCGRDLLLDAFGVQKRGKFGRKARCKECLAEEEAQRRAADPEGHRFYKRKWWAEHHHTEDERSGARSKARRWYRGNRQRHYEAHKQWLARNPERFKAIQRKYLAQNPVHIRRAVYMKKVVKDLTSGEWSEILDYFGYRCAYCLASGVELTMDHIVPVSKGGPHTASNVVPSCRSCNSKKGARPIFLMVNVLNVNEAPLGQE